jgi:MFS family permease
LSDKLGRRPVYLFGALSMGLSFLWFFRLLDSGSQGAVTLAIAGAMIAHGAMYAPQGAFIAELFPTRLRYSGASVAYQASSVLAGSLAPMVSLALYQAWNSSAPVVVYVMVGCLVSALAALVAPETRGIALDAAGAPRA